MSDEKQETSADIIAEMRKLGELDGKSTDKIPRSLMGLGLRTYADRLEAAATRERLLSKPPENDNSAPVVSTGDNSGNAAAMRGALEAARDLLLPQCNGGTAFAKACGETVNKIMDALAAPPRNCDLYNSYGDAIRAFEDAEDAEDYEEMADWLFAPAKPETKGESR
ncbi:MAG: hypothetical protein II649_02095 [Kiritimatiellae bacterium]|nr:hypothetical protein [Kiritimatiellia bacterium]